MKKLEFEIDGRKVEGMVSHSGSALWVHMAGETFVVEEPKRTRSGRGGRAGGAASAHPGQIVAPMPGKIIKIMVKENDVAKSGQVLLVMEAMKMEYTLKASAEGKVEKVLCAAGDQVTLGQILVKLEIK